MDGGGGGVGVGVECKMKRQQIYAGMEGGREHKEQKDGEVAFK